MIARLTRLFGRAFSAIAAWPKRYSIGGAVALVIALIVGTHLLTRTPVAPASTEQTAHVELATAASLSGAGGPLPVTGSVTSLSQATILGETSGEIVMLYHAIGDQVGAGGLIMAFENASQKAAVTQARGAYNAAVAAGAGTSLPDIAATARNAYTGAYTSLDSTLASDVDLFFGQPTAVGPIFLIDPSPLGGDHFSRARSALSLSMSDWQMHLATAATADPHALLDEADAVVKQAGALLVDIATVANKNGSTATSAQLAALTAARASVTSIQASITSAKQAYQTQNTSASAGTAASIEQAQGALAGAEANLEKTLVRSPISGTIVSLPVSQGDFVSAFSQVAVVSNPGALFVDVQVTPSDAKTLAVGNKATIAGDVPGVITFIAPALDPTTGKIEVKVGITADTNQLTDGEIVSLALERAARAATASASATTALAIPIIAVKIMPTGAIVFTITASSTLAAVPITLGSVLGDRVLVTAGLAPDLEIVTDARGRSEGETVVADLP